MFVALGIQYAKRMRRAILSFVACPALQYCSTLPHKRRDFGKKGYYYYSYYYWYLALGPVWAETRVQSGDWYGSGTLHLGQVLRGSFPLLSPAFFRCSHSSSPGASTFRHDVRDPSGGRWNCGRECCPVILPK